MSMVKKGSYNIMLKCSQMKRFVVVCILAIEILAILAGFIFEGKRKADIVVADIVIPQGTLLTVTKDISVSNGEETIIIHAGTKIVPLSMSGSDVLFRWDENETPLDADAANSGELGSVDNWVAELEHTFITDVADFEEQNLISNLVSEAEKRSAKMKKQYVQQSIIKGAVIALGWLIIGGLLSIVLMKKNRFGACVILLIGIPLIGMTIALLF